MKVASVTLHNFGSFYGVHQVNLSNRGLTFVLGENVDEPKMESNGSGKSTVFDALEWALYGKTPKRDGVNTVVNEEAGSKCWVVVQLQDGQEWWWVYRYRAMPEGNGVKLFRADHEKGVVENLTAMDEPVTTGIVEKVVGMDRKVFHAAVYWRQGDDFDFADATDGERKKLLARIIPELEECDVLCDRAKERHAVAQAAHSAVMVQVQGVEAALSGYQQTDLGKMEAAWRADRDRRLEAAQVAHQQAASAVQHVQAAVQTLASKQQELSSLVPPVAQTAWRDEFMKRNGLYVEVRLRAEALAERFDAASAILNSFEAMDAGV